MSLSSCCVNVGKPECQCDDLIRADLEAFAETVRKGERERIAKAIEAEALGVANDPEPAAVNHDYIARGLFWAARIARGTK